MRNKPEQRQPWSIQDSEELYMIQSWGRGYFSIDEEGRVCVRPRGTEQVGINMHGLVLDLVERGLDTPLLLRFGDILEDRIRAINDAFHRAIAEYKYEGSYRGVFPIKVNQQRHVVEEIVNYGRPYGLGLETGSKAELLIALAYHGDPDSLIVCNGFKDRDFFELALYATKLGKPIVLVIDRIEEIYLCVEAARRLDVVPRIGVRARLSSRGAGKWNESSGDRSKFGLAAEELIELVAYLRKNDSLHCLEMLHFHIGSQISEIRAIKGALREGSRIYVELHALGAKMGWIDVGGGLGVDYDGSQTSFHSSINYSLQEYANDVVSAVQDACDQCKLSHPYIVSESGRAIVAHHEVLVFDVLGRARARGESSLLTPNPGDHEIVHSLFEVWRELKPKNMLESYHDLLQLKEEVQSLFNLGYLGLDGRARCERLYWSCCQRILEMALAQGDLPQELARLPRELSDIYYCNFSVFQSLPDHWAVKQLFPMMPLQRLNERPTRRAVLADLTCDSDGKMDCFIGQNEQRDVIALHAPSAQPYYLGIFLVGAYQEVLGDLHNLFGDTNVVHVRMDADNVPDLAKVVEGDSVREVLSYVQYDSEELIARMRVAGEKALRMKRMEKQEVQELLKVYKQALSGQTYLQ